MSAPDVPTPQPASEFPPPAANDLPPVPVEAEKPSTVEQVICAWPMALVAVGGLIGGALGGGAYGLNMLAWKKGVRGPGLIGVSVVTGGVAIVGWLVVAGMIQGAL